MKILSPELEQPNKVNDTLEAKQDNIQEFKLTEETVDFEKILKLANQVRVELDEVTTKIDQAKIDIFEAAKETGDLTKKAVEQLTNIFAESLNLESSELPFALFLFGSSARNLMLPNSDLDLCIIYSQSCPETLKTKLKEAIKSLPFDDVEDIESWDSVDSMRKENCPSIMQQNKTIEATFAAGNIEIEKEHADKIIANDSREEKEERFITEFWLLHKADYRGRSSEHGANLKYDFGGSRDLVFLDWYYLLSQQRTNGSSQPSALSCLDLLEKEGDINTIEHNDLKSAMELILLTKFSLWELNKKENDDKLLYLSDFSLQKCYDEKNALLKKWSIHNLDEFIFTYYQAKGKLHKLTTNLYEKVSSSNPDFSKLWRTAQTKTSLDPEVKQILEEPNWLKLVPFAIASTSPEILHYIVQNYGNVSGFEYILRLISQNKYLTEEIKEDLLNSKLDSRIKRKLAA